MSVISLMQLSVEWDQMTGPLERKMLCVTAVHSDQKNKDPEQISPLIH